MGMYKSESEFVFIVKDRKTSTLREFERENRTLRIVIISAEWWGYPKLREEFYVLEKIKRSK